MFSMAVANNRVVANELARPKAFSQAKRARGLLRELEIRGKGL